MKLRSIRTGFSLVALTLAAMGCAANTAARVPIGPLSGSGVAESLRVVVDPPSPPAPPEVNGRMMMMWFPNRILDLFDIPRLGVDLGPGAGFDLSFTHYMRLAAMWRTSGGIGFETFRHPPAKFCHEEYVYPGGAFPGDMEGGLSSGWYQDTWDFRVELHLLIVGAHVCLNIAEIGDFFAGLAFFDPRHDDM